MQKKEDMNYEEKECKNKKKNEENIIQKHAGKN